MAFGFYRLDSLTGAYIGGFVRIAVALLVWCCSTFPVAHSAHAEYNHIVCVPQVPSIADLTVATSVFDIELLSASLYDNLVQLDGDGLPQAALAERWQVSADGLLYRFKIRRGVSFHSVQGFRPTRPMRASDVVFSLNRLLSADAFFAKIGDRHALATELPVEKIDSVVAVGDWVEIRLNSLDVEFVEKLTGHDSHILSFEYARFLTAENRSEQFGQVPIGTGAFSYLKHNEDEYQLRRFDDYWAGAVEFSALTFVNAADELDRFSKLRIGECAQAIDIGPQILAKADRVEGFEIQRGPILSVFFLALDTRLAPWDEVRARRALSLAINRKRILQLLFQFTGAEYANYSVHPDLLGIGQAKEPEYNPDLARELLQQVVPQGPISLTISTVDAARPHNPNPRRMAELVAQDLSAVGVDVSVKWVPLEKILALAIDLQERAYESLLLGYSVSAPLVSSFSSNLLGCEDGEPKQMNLSRLCDAQLDELLLSASRQPALEKRRVLNLAAAEKSLSLMQYVNILHAEHVDIIRDDIKGVQRRVTGFLDFRQGRVEH